MSRQRRGRAVLSLTVLGWLQAAANAGVDVEQLLETPACPAGSDSGEIKISYNNLLGSLVTLKAVTAEPATCEGYAFAMLDVTDLPPGVVTDTFMVSQPTAVACDLTFWIDETPPAPPALDLGPMPGDVALYTPYSLRVDASTCFVDPPLVWLEPGAPLTCALDASNHIRPSTDVLWIGSELPVDLTLAAADPSCAPFLFQAGLLPFQPELLVTTDPSDGTAVTITLDPLAPGGFGTSCAYVATTNDGIDVPFVLSSDANCAATSYLTAPVAVDLGNVPIDQAGALKLEVTVIADSVIANLRWQTTGSLTFANGAAATTVTVTGSADVDVIVPINGPHADVVLVDNTNLAIPVTGFGFGPTSGTLAPINVGTADRMQAPLRTGIEFVSSTNVTRVQLVGDDNSGNAIQLDPGTPGFAHCVGLDCVVDIQPEANNHGLAIPVMCDASLGLAGDASADANLVVTSTSFGGVSPAVSVTVPLHCDFAGGGSDDLGTDDADDDGDTQSYYSCGVAGGSSGLALVGLAGIIALTRRRRRAAGS